MPFLDRVYKRRWQINGYPIRAEVSSCSVTYENFGLQISLVLEDTHEQIFRINRNLPFSKARKKDFDTLCQQPTVVRQCRGIGCDSPTFAAGTEGLVRMGNGLCVTCHSRALIEAMEEVPPMIEENRQTG